MITPKPTESEKKICPAAASQVVARQDDAPFVGSGGKLEPEHRLADTPSRIDSIEAALQAAGVLKRA